jgi:Zn-dependent protease with chaperone function
MRQDASTLRDNLLLTLRLSGVSLLWLTGVLACVGTANGLAFALARAEGDLGAAATLGLFALANALALAAAAGVGTLLTPLAMRGALGSRELPASDPRAAELAALFADAGLPRVRIEVLDRHGPHFHNAIVTGLRGSRVFAPALFMTESLLRGLTAPELRAVVAHEAAHLTLGHLPGRFLAMGRATTLAAAGVFAYFLAALLWLPPVFVALGALTLPVAGALAPLLALRRTMRAQEFEADAFAVTRLGAEPGALLSALTKLECWSGREERRPRASDTHPGLAERARRLASLRVAVTPPVSNAA